MAVLMYNGQPIASTKYGEMLQEIRTTNGILKGDGTGNYSEGVAADLEYNNTASGLTATNTQDAIDEIDSQLNEKANKVQEDWITPTLLNGWTGSLRYRKTNFNELEILGRIKSPLTVGTPSNIVSFPLGYRPSESGTRFLCPIYDNTNGLGKFAVGQFTDVRNLASTSVVANTDYYISIRLPIN